MEAGSWGTGKAHCKCENTLFEVDGELIAGDGFGAEGAVGFSVEAGGEGEEGVGEEVVVFDFEWVNDEAGFEGVEGG